MPSARMAKNGDGLSFQYHLEFIDIFLIGTEVHHQTLCWELRTGEKPGHYGSEGGDMPRLVEPHHFIVTTDLRMSSKKTVASATHAVQVPCNLYLFRVLVTTHPLEMRQVVLVIQQGGHPISLAHCTYNIVDSDEGVLIGFVTGDDQDGFHGSTLVFGFSL